MVLNRHPLNETLQMTLDHNSYNFQEGRNEEIPEKPRSRNDLPVATKKNQLLTRNVNKSSAKNKNRPVSKKVAADRNHSRSANLKKKCDLPLQLLD